MEAANAIINEAIEALQEQAEAIQAKIEALENALSVTEDESIPVKPRRGRPRLNTQMEEASTMVKKPRGRPRIHIEPENSEARDTAQTAAEKRSKSWDTAKKAAAAERMRKYWAERKKQQ